jgi:hypothetical protein
MLVKAVVVEVVEVVEADVVDVVKEMTAEAKSSREVTLIPSVVALQVVAAVAQQSTAMERLFGSLAIPLFSVDRINFVLLE